MDVPQEKLNEWYQQLQRGRDKLHEIHMALLFRPETPERDQENKLLERLGIHDLLNHHRDVLCAVLIGLHVAGAIPPVERPASESDTGLELLQSPENQRLLFDLCQACRTAERVDLERFGEGYYSHVTSFLYGLNAIVTSEVYGRADPMQERIDYDGREA